MADFDRMEHEAERLKGKAEQAIGDATDNGSLETQGVIDQAKADLKDAGSDFHDAVDDAVSDDDDDDDDDDDR